MKKKIRRQKVNDAGYVVSITEVTVLLERDVPSSGTRTTRLEITIFFYLEKSKTPQKNDEVGSMWKWSQHINMQGVQRK